MAVDFADVHQIAHRVVYHIDRSVESDYSSSPERSPRGRSPAANGAADGDQEEEAEAEAFVSEHLRETGEYVSYKEIVPEWVKQVLLSVRSKLSVKPST